MRQDPTLHFETGGSAAKRDLNVLIGKNVRAGPHHGRRHVQPAGQLDLVAAARARGDARRGLPLHRHAGARVRHSAGLHQRPRARGRHHRPRGRRRADAAGLSPQRRGARRIDQLPVDDGGPSRRRGPPVRRSQRPARIRPTGLRASTRRGSANEHSRFDARSPADSPGTGCRRSIPRRASSAA